MTNNQAQAITLSQFNQRISRLVNGEQSLQCVWVTAETSDVRMAGGHCYLELIEKDPNTGHPLAKMRAAIWASVYYRIADKFFRETQQTLCSDIKVMVLVSASYNPVYGLSLNIHDINGAYTLGDVLRRRNEMIMRLSREGIINMNRELPWCAIPQRIAIISAPNAAGYGDFINHLYNIGHNRHSLHFRSKLFTASLQGERTAPSIIAALDEIAAQQEMWDCVVIIRGGGASADLLWFDNYDLAAHIAQFPIPVIIGIGHERDITLLDYVANMRVKTPTAAADWLISIGDNALGNLQAIATNMLRAVTDRLSGCRQQLSYIAGKLPAASLNVVAQANNRLSNAKIALASVADRLLRPEAVKLDNFQTSIAQALEAAISRARTALDAKQQLVNVLSPMATLKRGYSITRIAGHAVKSVDDIAKGEVIETIMADGIILSTALQSEKSADNECQDSASI